MSLVGGRDPPTAAEGVSEQEAGDRNPETGTRAGLPNPGLLMGEVGVTSVSAARPNAHP